VDGTPLAKRNADYQYTPAILCDMVYGKDSKEAQQSIADWKEYGVDLEAFYI
jgi:hypothetical protein